MSSYLRNVFTDLSAAFSSMAPGNMKSDFIGLQRSKLNGKSYSTRKLYVKNSDASVDDSVSVAEKMDQRSREGATLANNAPDAEPSEAPSMNATAAAVVIDSKTKSTSTKSDNAKELLLVGAGLADGGCAIPETIGSRDKVGSEVSHLKVLSMLHLDVIEQQQRQIQLVEKEAQRLKAENDTLKNRLERMTRRTHLAEKTEHTNPVGRPRKLQDSPAPKRKYQRVELDTPVGSPNKPASGRGTPQAKDGSTDNLNSSADLRRRQQQQRRAEKLAKKEEKKSATNRQDSKESRDSKEEEKYHRTDVMYPCLSDLRLPEQDPDFPEDEDSVQVPSWRIVTFQPGCSSDTTEPCDETTFEQRHSKLEHDERKRKRWDFQRIRELREHERLVNKQKQREYAQWGHILTTFYPDDNDAEQIEMCETIPLITFGVQVPVIKPSEFELPWFDAKDRERDEQRRKTRRRSSRR